MKRVKKFKLHKLNLQKIPWNEIKNIKVDLREIPLKEPFVFKTKRIECMQYALVSISGDVEKQVSEKLLFNGLQKKALKVSGHF